MFAHKIKRCAFVTRYAGMYLDEWYMVCCLFPPNHLQSSHIPTRIMNGKICMLCQLRFSSVSSPYPPPRLPSTATTLNNWEMVTKPLNDTTIGQPSVREGKRRATTPPPEPSHKKVKAGAPLDDLIQQVLESLNDRQRDMEKAFRTLLKASSVSAQALAHAPELEANAVASELEMVKVRLNKGITGLKRSKLMLEETCMALKVKEEPQDDDIGPRPRGSESVVAVSREPARDWVLQEFDELEGRLQDVIMCLREAREAQQP